MVMRAELARPGLQLVSAQQYNELFTVHGTIMMLLFATPTFAGFANAVMPLQIGAPDVAFPRLNAFTYWVFLFGGLMVLAGFLTPEGAASFGWFAYAPLNSATFTPGSGADLWTMGLACRGSEHHPRLRQLHHHDHLPARAGDDRLPDAAVHLERPVHLDPRAARLPGTDRGAARAGGGPEVRRARLRLRQRRRAPVAAPVLVLRASRGLHRGPAVLRRRHRDPPGLQPQAALRLRRARRRDDRHHRPVGDGLGAPHVRDGRACCCPSSP